MQKARNLAGLHFVSIWAGSDRGVVSRTWCSQFSLWWTEGAGRGLKNRHDNKKLKEKALIPLPPTGFASVFCAIPDVVQTDLQPRRAVGLCRRSSISQCAKFRKEM